MTRIALRRVLKASMRSLVALIAIGLTLSSTTSACEPDNLEELVGFTLIEITAVPGEFEGADFDKVVKLENGMRFEFTSYNYQYEYHPSVAIFAQHLTLERLKELKIQNPPQRGITIYKLLSEDEVYDVRRIK